MHQLRRAPQKKGGPSIADGECRGVPTIWNDSTSSSVFGELTICSGGTEFFEEIRAVPCRVCEAFGPEPRLQISLSLVQRLTGLDLDSRMGDALGLSQMSALLWGPHRSRTPSAEYRSQPSQVRPQSWDARLKTEHQN